MLRAAQRLHRPVVSLQLFPAVCPITFIIMSNYDPLTGKVGNIGPRTIQSVNIATNNGPIVGRVFNAANKQSIRLTGKNFSALIQQYRLNNIDIINFFK